MERIDRVVRGVVFNFIKDYGEDTNTNDIIVKKVGMVIQVRDTNELINDYSISNLNDFNIGDEVVYIKKYDDTIVNSYYTEVIPWEVYKEEYGSLKI